MGSFRSSWQQVSALLDDGVSLYRRYVGGFAVLAGMFSLPALLVTFNAIFHIERFEDASFTDLVLIVFGLFLSSHFIIPPLTRATRLEIDGETFTVGRVVWRWPKIGRSLIALVYGGVLAIFWGIVISFISSILFSCVGVFFIVGFLLSSAVTEAFLIFFPIVIVLLLVAYGGYLMFNSTAIVAALYGVQPLLDDTIPLRKALQLSWSLLFHRFSYNTLVFCCAAAVFGMVAMIVTLTIGLLLPAPFGIQLGVEHPLFRGLSAVAWVIGLNTALPLLPIWSTLHYRQMLAERTGVRFAVRLQQLRQAVTSSS
ncbi:hypothetical protein [Chloroflexus sp.]|uniref:hypothetical protein n=1 Tax=Chloroflexus sp. TaxID=1904827 RepID=UPI003D0F0128